MDSTRLAFIALVACASPSSGSAQGTPQPEVVSSFAAFLGAWEPVEAVAANSPRAMFLAERYTAGPNNRILWFTQGPHRVDTGRDAVPGFIYWHPTAQRFQYSAFNTFANLYFEGYIREVDSQHYELFYTVHYPRGGRAIPQGAGESSRQFRDVHRLVEPNIMELSTWVLQADGTWTPFSPTGAVSRFKRGQSSVGSGGDRSNPDTSIRLP